MNKKEKERKFAEYKEEYKRRLGPAYGNRFADAPPQYMFTAKELKEKGWWEALPKSLQKEGIWADGDD